MSGLSLHAIRYRDLRLPEPAHHLEVGSGSHAEQTGRTMIAYEGVCQRERPGAVGGTPLTTPRNRACRDRDRTSLDKTRDFAGTPG